MAVTIKQGDSVGIFLNLKQNGSVLLPEYVDDIEVCVGEGLRLTAVEGTVKFDSASKRWYIWPTQEQTFSLEEGSYKVEIRVKYHNNNTVNVKGQTIFDRIKVKGAASREVL